MGTTLLKRPELKDARPKFQQMIASPASAEGVFARSSTRDLFENVMEMISKDPVVSSRQIRSGRCFQKAGKGATVLAEAGINPLHVL